MTTLEERGVIEWWRQTLAGRYNAPELFVIIDRATKAESDLSAALAALKPFALYGKVLGPVMDDLSNPITIATSRGQATVTPADFREAYAATAAAGGKD